MDSAAYLIFKVETIFEKKNVPTDVHAQSPTDLLSVRPGRTWSYSSTMTLHNGNGESAGGEISFSV
jgi:hypothetical protein